MLPVNYGGHTAYQDTFVSEFLNLCPDPFAVPKQTPEKGKKRGDKTPCDTDSAAAKLLPLMQRIHLPNNNPFYLIFRLYKTQFLDVSVRRGLINPRQLSLAGDGPPLKLQGWNVPKGSATAQKDLSVAANESFHILTATWVGIFLFPFQTSH